MKKILFVLFAIVFSIGSINAQTTEDSVKAVMNKLFEGMKNSDPSLVIASFGDSAVLQTIATSKDGKTAVRNVKVSDFAAQVSKAAKGALDERIEFETVKIDANLAIAWTPYKFYYNGQFSHCGVNSFQLVRFNGVWKIQYLIDTRRHQGCE
ncbi:MAG: nuclear transport factor 2 family protein [Chitinophagaceae bacterium]|nr:nuclear transport factor 2 family protein [Chitinophagaceae bacterium]